MTAKEKMFESIIGKGEINRIVFFPHNVFQNLNLKFQESFNSLPNNKITDQSKLKGFADDKMNVTQKNEIYFMKGRKHCWKSRKCWLPAFSTFPTMFSKGILYRVVKSRDCLVKR